LFQKQIRYPIISNPVVIPRDQHSVSRANISPNALKVLYRLHQAGFQAHLVGGGVRDLLLGREPKDFDIATDAHPEQVKAVFRNCRLVGRRFRLAHVHFGREIIEVATFRAGADAVDEDSQQTEDGRVLSDNVYGTIEQDALRRDFSVNALYYSIDDFSIVDYAGGVEDLQNGVLRLLGDPETRYREDPVRMLRAVRFAAKLGFRIATDTEQPITELAPLLADIPPARLFDEVLKLFLSGHAVASFEKLRQYGLFAALFPDTERCLAQLDHEFPLTLVTKGLENTDRRLNEDKPVTPAFLFAVLLWEPVRQQALKLQADGEAPYPAVQKAAGELMARQVERVALPRRFSAPMQEIWSLQSRFLLTRGKRPQRLLSHPRFRAAFDFLLLRADAGEADPKLAAWWAELADGGSQEAPPPDKPGSSRRRSRRGGRRRRRKPADSGGE
jgi:poly(A) polymerase